MSTYPMKYPSYQGSSRPAQKIPFSQKDPTTEEGKAWANGSGKYFRDTCQRAVNREEALKYYRLANGQLDASDYLYVTNPLNTPRLELQGYPAKLANYDIISPNINLILGEKAKRYFPPIVIAKNTDYQNRALEEQTKLTIQELQKQFINEIARMGVPVDKEEETKSLEEIAHKVKNLPDLLSSQAQDVLEYIMDLNDLPRNLRKGFYDWICQAMVYSYKDVYKNKTKYEIVSPIHMAYLCAPQNDFIEDGEAVRATYILSLNEVYDRFQDDPDFTSELEEFITSTAGAVTAGTNFDHYIYGLSDRDTGHRELFRNLFGYLPEELYAHGIKVEHIQWRSFAKIGKLCSYDIWGNKMTTEVSEDFKSLPTDEIEWEWVDEIWENYCIGDKFWIGARPIPIQRGSYNDPHKAKLLYNGRNYFARHTRPTSLVRKGETYQKTVNIIKYRAEQTLAKNLDKVILFPLGFIPKKEGWDEDKLMYYVRAHSFLFYDDTRPNASALVQGMKDLDLSSYQHLLTTYQLVQTVKQEWNQVCGFNPQRIGEVSPSAGKGVTEAAQETSYTMSETLFLQYEEFEKTEYTGMLELSKYAFVDGIQSQFIKQDGTTAFLNLYDPDSFINSDIAIFVKNGGREAQKLEIMRNQVQAFVQNAVDPKAILSIIEAEDFAKLHKIMDEVDMKNEARRQEQMQSEQQVQASKERMVDAELKFKYYDTDLDNATNVQVALIEQGMQITEQMRNVEQSGGSAADMGGLRDNLEKNAIELLKNATKMKEINAKVQMNKLDNETALKNKVVGQK